MRCKHGWESDYERETGACVECRDELARSLAATQRAKAENDERYMLERDEARSQRDELVREVARLTECKAKVEEEALAVRQWVADAIMMPDGEWSAETSEAPARKFLTFANKLRGGPAPSGGGEEKR